MGVARIVGMTPKLRLQLWLCLLICFQSITVCGRAQTAAADPKTILHSKYKFAPATCHDTPIGTTLFVEVNFQIH
jgi:hypothetical protein